jgi:hypothetical protein
MIPSYLSSRYVDRVEGCLQIMKQSGLALAQSCILAANRSCPNPPANGL